MEGAGQLAAPASSILNLEDVSDDYRESFKQKVLNKLLDLSSGQFEKFAETLLKGYGFQKTEVTGKTGDGGIAAAEERPRSG